MKRDDSPLGSQRLVLGGTLSTPDHRYQEHLLGFETDIACVEGIPASSVNITMVHNTRERDEFVEGLIDSGWEDELKRDPGARDDPMSRYEGGYVDTETGTLFIHLSDERYKSHAALRKTLLPKPYQSNLFTINGIPLTEDNRIPVVTRNPKYTDQGRIKHTAPAGFVNVKAIDEELRSENVSEATMRKLFDEYDYSNSIHETPHGATERELTEELRYRSRDGFPPEVFDPDDMRILGIIYNHARNFDYAASVIVPLNAMPEDIRLKGDEHEKIAWYDTDLFTLRNLLFELAVSPETNSGHLRGDLALTIGHLYGKDEYKAVLLDVTKRLAKYIE